MRFMKTEAHHLTSSKGLAGSTLHINEGLRILIEEALVPVDTAINSCTKNPAACLKIDDRKGSIKVGLDADLVVLTVIIRYFRHIAWEKQC